MRTPSAKQLILFSGLPGTGKSSLSEQVAAELGYLHLSHDEISAALNRTGMYNFSAPFEKRRLPSEEVIRALVVKNLNIGSSIVVDTLAESDLVRSRYRAATASAGGLMIPVYCYCSDLSLQRSRLNSRKKKIDGWGDPGEELIWRIASRFEPWSGEVLSLDSINPISVNLAALIHHVLSQSE